MPHGGNQPMVITSPLIRRARFLVVMTVAIAVLLVAASFLLPRIYRAECKLVPSSRFQNTGGPNLSGALLGASSFMGLNLGGPGNDLSQLFVQIVRDHKFTRKVLDAEFVDSNSQTATLARHIESGFDGSEPEYLKLAKKFNRKFLKIGIDERTGITTLAIEMEDPLLARDLVNFCEEELNSSHRRILTEQSQQMVAFLDGRLESAAQQLLGAEETLETFYENNRVIQGAPNLEFERGRLLRDIQLKNEVFLSLSGQLEMTRIEMFKNMPTIVVLANAVTPVKPYKPNRPLVVFLSFVVASFLSFCVVLFQVGKQRWADYNRDLND